MTDPDLDELASAHLDGATTPEEAARVAGDPALQARVEALRRVRAAVSEAPGTDPAARDAAIAAALTAFAEDTPANERASVPAPAVLTPRRGPSTNVLRVLGAAAAIAFIALLVPVLGRLADSSDQEATSFDSTGAAIGDQPEDLATGGGAEDGGGVTSTTAASADGSDLGSFEDLAALAAAVAADESWTQRPAAALDEVAPETAEWECTNPTVEGYGTSATSTIHWARAVVAGDAVIVRVHLEAGGDRTLSIYRAEDCSLLDRRSL